MTTILLAMKCLMQTDSTIGVRIQKLPEASIPRLAYRGADGSSSFVHWLVDSIVLSLFRISGISGL
jgi:hypothetical protein